MAEQADATDLKSVDFPIVWVQVPLRLLTITILICANKI